MKKLFILISVLLFSSAIQAQVWKWAYPIQSSQFDRTSSFIKDVDGNLYLSGQCSDSTVFDDALVDSAGCFLAKYQSNGSIVWVKRFDADKICQTIIDEDKNIYLTGTFGYTKPFVVIDGDTILLLGHQNLFVAKIDSSQNLQWLKAIVNTSYLGIEFNDLWLFNDSVCVSGKHSPGFVCNADTLNDNGFFITSFNVFDGNSHSRAASVFYVPTPPWGHPTYHLTSLRQISANNYKIIIQYTGDTLFWGGDTIPYSLDCSKTLFADMDGSLHLSNIHIIIESGYHGYALILKTIFTNNYTYIMGQISNAPAMVDTVLVDQDQKFIAVFDTSLNIKGVLLIKEIPYKDVWIRDFELDSANNIYLSGFFQDSLIVNSTFISMGGYYDSFVIKADQSGNFLWIKKAFTENLGGMCCGAINEIVLNNHHIYCSGIYSENADFGSIHLDGLGMFDVFIADLDILYNSVEEFSSSITVFKIFPNPANSSITLYIPPLQSDAEVCIFNSLGEQVLKSKVHKAESEVKIDVAKLPAGIYLLRIAECGLRINYTGKFVKQ